jgi:hypothetical protein
MNVYLRLLAKPHKKEKLLVSNNVLKLACKLLKVRSPANADSPPRLLTFPFPCRSSTRPTRCRA